MTQVSLWDLEGPKQESKEAVSKKPAAFDAKDYLKPRILIDDPARSLYDRAEARLRELALGARASGREIVSDVWTVEIVEGVWTPVEDRIRHPIALLVIFVRVGETSSEDRFAIHETAARLLGVETAYVIGFEYGFDLGPDLIRADWPEARYTHAHSIDFHFGYEAGRRLRAELNL